MQATERAASMGYVEAKDPMRLAWGWESVSQVTLPTGTSVYRLYNKLPGDHLYITKGSEYDGLLKRGWIGEDV